MQEAFSRIPKGTASDPSIAIQGERAWNSSISLSRPRHDRYFTPPEPWSNLSLLYLLYEFTQPLGQDEIQLEYDMQAKGGFVRVQSPHRSSVLEMDKSFSRIISKTDFQRWRNSVLELPLRGRPYFTLAPQLGRWASWGLEKKWFSWLSAEKNPDWSEWKSNITKLYNQKSVDITFVQRESISIPEDRNEILNEADQAMAAQDYVRAIACYEKLLEKKPSKINTVIYLYYLAQLHMAQGEDRVALDYLQQGLDIVHYPALVQLKDQILTKEPTQRKSQNSLTFVGERPSWGEEAESLLRKIEQWRGRSFHQAVVIMQEEQEGAQLGEYDPQKKILYMSSELEDWKPTLVHELIHALQDQHDDISRFHASPYTQDEQKAYQSLLEGEAIVGVSQVLSRELDTSFVFMSGLAPQQVEYAFFYGYGTRYMLDTMQNGGWEAWDKIFTLPPMSTAQLVDRRKQKRGLPKITPRSNEILLQAHCEGALSFAVFLYAIAPDRVEEILIHYRSDAKLIFEDQQGKEHRWYIEFDTRLAAKEVAQLSFGEEITVKQKGRWVYFFWR